MKKPTVTLYVVAFGGYWERFGEQWTNYVLALNTKPDRVLIISDIEIDTDFDVIVTDVPENAKVAKLRQVAVDNSDTDWLVSIDLDDTFFAHTLDNLNDEYDIHAFGFDSTFDGIKSGDPQKWDSFWNNDGYVWCGISANLAIKLSVLKEVEGYPNINHEDAGMLIKLKKANKKVFFDNTIRFFYHQRNDSISKKDSGIKDQELNNYFNTIKNS